MKTVILGDEYDETLREALHTVLLKNGAIGNDKSWGVGGSQEIEMVKVKLGEETVIIESETFVGLTITGSISLVESLAQEVRVLLNKSGMSC